MVGAGEWSLNGNPKLHRKLKACVLIQSFFRALRQANQELQHLKVTFPACQSTLCKDKNDKSL